MSKRESDSILRGKLLSHGCTKEPRDFREALKLLLAETCPGQTVEELLIDWRRNRDFCALARRQSGMQETGDLLIAETLLNMRKHPEYELSLRDRAPASRGGSRPKAAAPRAAASKKAAPGKRRRKPGDARSHAGAIL